MRARHRHFNAKAAGASNVYDARFISGLSDNDAVGTWTNRTGSDNATQATAANKPIYKTNQLNGNPVVQFDGSNDNLEFGQQSGSQAWALCMVKRTSTNTYQGIYGLDRTTGSQPLLGVSNHSDTNYGPVCFGNSSGSSAGVDSKWAKGSSLRQNEWRALYLVWLGGGSIGASYYNGWDDGVSFALSDSNAIGTITSSGVSRIGDTSNSFGGQIAIIVSGLTTSTNPLRKRISHAAAYSFKLASS